MKDSEIPLRITVVEPPPEVVFALQLGRAELQPPTRSAAGSIRFDFTVRARAAGESGALVLLGPATQGTPRSRFVYINSGTYAGDPSSCWSRRAKVPLAGISPKLLRELKAVPGSRLEARITGSAKDGGPVCASVPLLGQGWSRVGPD